MRVLPIGDSYTAGYISVGGWRPFVGDVDFVGPFCDAALADCEHAGISGQRLDEMVVVAPALVREHPADVVVLWGGYNDVSRGAAPAEAADRMGALIAAVRDAGAPRTVVVTTFRPHTALGDAIDAYTALVRERVAGWGVEVADVRAVADDSAVWIECTDNVHPTHRGYEAAGRVIDAAIHGGAP